MTIDIELRIANYKCFGEEAGGYERLLPINLIIGRNNSGKSTLLDLLQQVTAPGDITRHSHRGHGPQVQLRAPLEAGEIRRVFPDSTSGGGIPASNHWEYGRKWIDAVLTWEIGANGTASFLALDPPLTIDTAHHYHEGLASTKGNPFTRQSFRRLLADRDIAPEAASTSMSIAPNGSGFSNVVAQFITRASLPSTLVEETLLEELNRIFRPDAIFSAIVVQQLENNHWEIYLEEAGKGSIPLSQSGSGLKTILLVLGFVHLLPVLERKPLNNYLFGFEELENNLHPALQRRLLLYLRNIAIREGTHFFLTTHSSVIIDLFANDSEAQIIHVTHDGTQASARPVHTYVDNCGVLDDLDVRASDLLQANGIVWVEGPSDRLYFNRWVELWAHGELREGAHYQCVFYGGRLLSHLSASDPTVDAEEVVRILRVNRNAIVLIDSDRSAATGEINATKQRIVDEISKGGGIGWVTAGREVENYIPVTSLESVYKNHELVPLDAFEAIEEYLERASEGEGKRFLRNKVLFAERVTPTLQRNHLEDILDLGSRLDEVCRAIRSWSRIPEAPAA